MPTAVFGRSFGSYIKAFDDDRYYTFGQYCFNKLPFGITNAPEYFQKKMSAVGEGLQGVLCLIGNIVIFGRDKAEDNEVCVQS